MSQKENTNASAISDISILLFAGVVLATYQRANSLSPEHLLSFIHAVLLWFIMRVAYRLFPAGRVSVFAFASYPYYLWEFLVVWVLLGTICVSGTEKFLRARPTPGRTRRPYILAALSACALLSASFACLKRQYPYYRANSEWAKLRPYHAMKAYEGIAGDYGRLYARLNHNPKFVFEYAVVLNATGRREEADSILSRGLQLSCDPMFYNVKGRNHHEMGEYGKAEECYTNSTRLLPGRVYPYYLLTRLYADSVNFQPAKMQQAALAVLEMEPKVHSAAIREMRDEIREILKEKGVADGQ